MSWPRRGRKRKHASEEIANWWFSDEDLQEAVSHIIDVPSTPRRPRKPEPRETQVTTHNAQEEQ